MNALGSLRRINGAFDRARWAFLEVWECCPGLFIAFVVNAAVVTCVPAGIALSLRGLVNSANEALGGQPLSDTGVYFWLLLGFAATFVGSAGATIHRYLSIRFEIELGVRLNENILRHHATMPYVRLEQQSYRDNLRRAQTTPEVYVTRLFVQTVDLTTKILQASSLLLILAAIEPLLFLLLLPVGIPFLAFRWRLTRRQFEELDRRVEKRRWMDYFQRLLGDVDQAAETRLLGIAGEFTNRWSRYASEFRGLRLDYQRFEFLGTMIFAFLSVSAVYVAFAHAIDGIVKDRLTIGDLAIFGGAAAQLRALVETSVVLIASLRWQLLGVSKILDYFAIEGASASGRNGANGSPRGLLEFRNVGFRYPGSAVPVLTGLSFTIESGEAVALVGENGAGKSTIAKLATGLYQPDSGAVLLDGRDTREIPGDELRSAVGCLFQHYGRYAATAAENIAFGDWDRLKDDRAALESIVERTGLGDLVDALPNGLDTLLGRNFSTHQLSVGQWQRLAMAMLFARESKILVLDEPTSNLDIKAEAEYFRLCRELGSDRTLLIISHRFSTVAMADRILVIDQGQIVESGAHNELVERSGRYATLFGLARAV